MPYRGPSTELATTALPRTGAPPRTGIHPAWWVALVAFVALLGAAGFRAAPGGLDDPAAGGVRLAADPDVDRGQREPDLVRSDGPVRRRADGSVRHPPGGHRGPGPGRGWQRLDDLRPVRLAVVDHLGPPDRRRHR